jgi:transposase-like protein
LLRERARTGGLKLAGEGGLLGKLTKMVVKGALEGEIDDHLGYSKHDPAGHPIHPGSNLEIRLAYEQSGTYTGAFPADLNISVRAVREIPADLNRIDASLVVAGGNPLSSRGDV